jgi:ATP-dependent helicase/nuclease subunit B
MGGCCSGLSMTFIATHAIDAAFWPQVADTVGAWLRERHAQPRDAIVLVPHSGLLAPVRHAFAGRGGWQPRIDTVRTLAASLAPPAAPAPGMLCGDRVADRLTATVLLASSLRNADIDPRAAASIVASFVQTAQALHDAAGRQAPLARPAWWHALREALPPVAGPGAYERQWARMAVEWAAAAPSPATDALARLAPSAWVVVRAAGIDPGAWLPPGSAPQLVLDADGDPAQPWTASAPLPPPRCRVVAGAEDEAQAACMAIVEALDCVAGPVALIAQDRLVVRRIRALLERVGVGLDDDTGWTLSTTRAAAGLMAWLRAAKPGAGRDAALEALRAERANGSAIDAIERAWRRDRTPEPWAQAIEDDRQQRCGTWQPAQPRSLAKWLDSLRSAAPGLMQALAADAAGRQVLDVLGLTESSDAVWAAAAQSTPFTWAQFIAWVDDTLEGSAWRPTPSAGVRVAAVPLARAVLRPFAAIVFPGCDARHLGVLDNAQGLLPPSVAQAFGVIHAEQRRERERLAFAQVLRAPQLTLLRRTHDAGEALAPSPWLERALLERRRAGSVPALVEPVQLPLVRVFAQPVARPAPVMAAAMPAMLSATRVQALRDCPYRFFAGTALGLSEAEELDDDLETRDFGNWMHGVLLRFHAQRSGNDDRVELMAAADAEQAARGLDAAALLPFRAGFDRFVELYLEWLAAHEKEGWRFSAGELAAETAPPELEGVVLQGRIDRIDADAQSAAMLIDYKTGNADKLKKRVREPLEDTQLAFYAALLAHEAIADAPAPALRACYLALSERKPPMPVEHADVAASAQALVAGLAQDLKALRQGHGAPALGQGDVCRWCHVRGLCRRDHWSPGA